MAELRTISALEHETIPIFANASEAAGTHGPWLTEIDAKSLLRVNEARRGFCQFVAGGVKLAQHCGILKLPGCILEVLPKVGFDNLHTTAEVNNARAALIAMLRSAGCVPLKTLDVVGQEAVRSTLLDVFIREFLSTALEQARRGLLNRYVTHREDLTVVRGRFDSNAHFRRNVARPYLVRCEYDDFTVDNPFNQAIRATLEACKPWIGDVATERLWFETHTRFANVASIRLRATDVGRLRPLDRLTRRYEQVLSWCSWLLSLHSPSLQAGEMPAPGLLFDMNKVFEAHVCTLYERNGADVIRQAPRMALASRGNAPVFQMVPDVTLWRGGTGRAPKRIVRIIDAKWKRLDSNAEDLGVNQEDIYQLLAYAHRYQCTELELAYPMTAALSRLEPPHFEISSARMEQPIRIWVRLVPLWDQRKGSLGESAAA